MSIYTLHGSNPAEIVTPTTPEALAETLRDAVARKLAVVPWGGGTRQHLGAPPSAYDVALATAQLNRISAYDPAAMQITVEAGVTLASIQATLAPHGQWLPWNPPLPERASVGGLLASGAVGLLCLSYGCPRRWTLGLRVALGDGRLVQSDDLVSKTFSGYDTHRLHIGALGTLGVIVEATFRVQPLPEHRQTLLASFTDGYMPAQAIAALRAAPLQPSAIVVLNQSAEATLPALHTFLTGQPIHFVVVARYAGTAAAVSRQIREATRRCVAVGARTIELCEADDETLWAAIANFTAPAEDGSICLRAAAPEGALTPVAALMERTATARGWQPQQLGVAGPGLFFSRWPVADVSPAAVADALAEVRAGMDALGGYVVVEEAAPTLRLDRWGPEPEGAAIMRTLRANWDPVGILNPGRYVM